ncbi:MULTISPECIES: phage minor capsid protein [unclassified Leucobacter]|uniref:phage minor capsid protein n=1 Tax=unclassified Leucobacter TaxID=2621730 RepID=UPI0006214099|nr:phage minor capsid protein [Leucobacter sp. Ag1]KKI18721.1 hypothetical protein XM48_10590 [Leucobacter sp. Ag1]
MAEQWPGGTPANLIDDLGHAIAERYRAIEAELEATLRRYAEQALDEPPSTAARLAVIRDLRRQAERLVGTVSPEALARLVTEEAASGASAEIARQLLTMPAYSGAGVAALTQAGALAVAAVELEFRDTLRALNARVLRLPADAYQRMTAQMVPQLLAGLTTSQALHQRMLDRYLAEGITGFVDQGGRRWTIGAYAEMATRTAAARAWRDQSVASMAAHGIQTFTPVIGASACTKCGAWAGKTITDGGPAGTVTVRHAITGEPVEITVDGTLDEMRAAGWGHPNCRCVLVPSLPGAANPTDYSTHDPQKQADRDELRRLEREVRQAKRDGDPREIGAAQADLRDHVRKTGLIRREYREQLPFADGGDKNPRGRTARPRPSPSSSAAKVESALRDLIPGVRVTGLEHVTKTRMPQVLGNLSALEDLVRRFPALKQIPEITFTSEPGRSRLAWVSSNHERSKLVHVGFNLARDLTPTSVERIRAVRWFHMAEGVDGRRYVTIHELGHAADVLTRQAANREGMRLLRDLVDPGGTLKTDAGLLKRAHARGLISEYATKSVYEMVAEAFATVETSPTIATDFEKAVHAALVKALRGR